METGLEWPKNRAWIRRELHALIRSEWTSAVPADVLHFDFLICMADVASFLLQDTANILRIHRTKNPYFGGMQFVREKSTQYK